MSRLSQYGPDDAVRTYAVAISETMVAALRAAPSLPVTLTHSKNNMSGTYFTASPHDCTQVPAATGTGEPMRAGVRWAAIRSALDSAGGIVQRNEGYVRTSALLDALAVKLDDTLHPASGAPGEATGGENRYTVGYLLKHGPIVHVPPEEKEAMEQFREAIASLSGDDDDDEEITPEPDKAKRNLKRFPLTDAEREATRGWDSVAARCPECRGLARCIDPNRAVLTVSCRQHHEWPLVTYVPTIKTTKSGVHIAKMLPDPAGRGEWVREQDVHEVLTATTTPALTDGVEHTCRNNDDLGAACAGCDAERALYGHVKTLVRAVQDAEATYCDHKRATCHQIGCQFYVEIRRAVHTFRAALGTAQSAREEG